MSHMKVKSQRAGLPHPLGARGTRLPRCFAPNAASPQVYGGGAGSACHIVVRPRPPSPVVVTTTDVVCLGTLPAHVVGA